MYNNIVVAFDDSEFSKAALTESAYWVKKHGGHILLVHAVFFDEEEFVISPEQREKRFELGKRACFMTQESFSSEFGLNGNLEAMVCEGEAHEAVVNVAEARKADLIALGTHGRKGLKKIFLGSVTSRVIVSSRCDVLVVKKPCVKCTGDYKSILLSYDGSEFSKRALARACQLSQLDGSEVTVLYVIPNYKEMVGFFSTSFIKDNLRRDAERLMEKAVELSMDYGVKINTEIAEGDEAEKTVEVAKRLKNDVIIMGSHGWKGLNRAIIGDIAEKVIVDSPCSILVVK